MRLGDATGQFGIFRAPYPVRAAPDRLHHQHVGDGFVVVEVLRVHWANGTHAIGTPASDWRAFSVALIQLSPSGKRADAGRTRQSAGSSTFAGSSPFSRRARAASISRRRTKITIAAVVPRCSCVRS